MADNREYVLAALLVLLFAVTYFVLQAVLQVIVFAITLAYVLFPLREKLRERGLSNRLASATVTVGALLAVLIALVPFVYAFYQRRQALINTLEELPDTVTLEVGGFVSEIDVAGYQQLLEEYLSDLAVSLALAIPDIVFSFTLFMFVIFGLLHKPHSVRTAVYEAVPAAYHDILTRLHERTREVLYALYVIQLATAVGTFLIALPFFFVLGYSAPVWLAFFSGMLQFLPVVGPSVLIGALAAADLAFLNETNRAILVLVVGLPLLGLLPDIIIRPRMAKLTGDFSVTLYFIGFVGGLLTVGPIGFVVGPLVIALLVETMDMLAGNGDPEEVTAE